MIRVAALMLFFCSTGCAFAQQFNLSDSERRTAAIADCYRLQMKGEQVDIFDAVAGIFREKYLSYFLSARTVLDVCKTMERIHAEEEPREILSRADTGTQLAARSIAIFLSPVLLIFSLLAGFFIEKIKLQALTGLGIAAADAIVTFMLKLTHYVSDEIVGFGLRFLISLALIFAVSRIWSVAKGEMSEKAH